MHELCIFLFSSSQQTSDVRAGKWRGRTGLVRLSLARTPRRGWRSAVTGTEYEQLPEAGRLAGMSSDSCFVTHQLCGPEHLTKFPELHFLPLKMQAVVLSYSVEALGEPKWDSAGRRLNPVLGPVSGASSPWARWSWRMGNLCAQRLCDWLEWGITQLWFLWLPGRERALEVQVA